MTILGSYSIKVVCNDDSLRASLYINDRFIQKIKPNRMFLGGAPIHSNLLRKGSISIVTTNTNFEILSKQYPAESWDNDSNNDVDTITQLVAIGNRFYNMNYSQDGDIRLVKKEVNIVIKMDELTKHI